MPSAIDSIPGPRSSQAFQAAGFFTRGGPYFDRLRERHGEIFRVHVADEKPWVVVSSPEHVKQVFTGDPSVFHAGSANSILLPLLGDSSVLLLDGAQHMRQRKLLLPAFHGARMERYGDIMREIAEREVEAWPIGTPMQLAPRMQDVTLEVIMRAVFGMEEGAELNHVRGVLLSLIDQVMKPSTFLGLAVLGPHRYRALPTTQRMLRPADEALQEVFTQRRRAGDLEEREDILSLLMLARDEEGNALNDRELRDELLTLLLAGHETTATSLSWAVERLLRNPPALERLQAELDEGREEYLDAVIRETLRLRPVVPVVLRDLQQEVELGGHRLPAGTRIGCSITLAHRNPDIYPDPAAFRPERFLEAKPGTYTWIPFGGGVRRCLGASFALFEMKQVLPAIIRGLDLRAVQPRPERVTRRLVTLTPKERAEVVVQGRRRQASREVATLAA